MKTSASIVKYSKTLHFKNVVINLFIETGWSGTILLPQPPKWNDRHAPPDSASFL